MAAWFSSAQPATGSFAPLIVIPARSFGRQPCLRVRSPLRLLTWGKSGRQFVVVAAGGGNKYDKVFTGKIVAFALPKREGAAK